MQGIGRKILKHIKSVGTRPKSTMSPPSHKDRPFTVFVEGNIGSGKTTFLNNFSKSDACILSEPVELWRNAHGHNLLGLMYENPSRWSLTFQSYVQLTMLDLHTRRTDHSVKLMERSIYSARYCFVENLVQNGVMPEAEFVVLDEWFSWITSTLDIGGDLIVYLRTSPEVVHKRVCARARKEETCVALEYLQQLHDLHERWLCNKSDSNLKCPIPVLVLDANKEQSAMEEEIQRCKSIILHKDLQGMKDLKTLCQESASAL